MKIRVTGTTRPFTAVPKWFLFSDLFMARSPFFTAYWNHIPVLESRENHDVTESPLQVFDEWLRTNKFGERLRLVGLCVK